MHLAAFVTAVRFGMKVWVHVGASGYISTASLVSRLERATGLTRILDVLLLLLWRT